MLLWEPTSFDDVARIPTHGGVFHCKRADLMSLNQERATMERSMHAIRFPGESDEYLAARNRVLEAEADLGRLTEQRNLLDLTSEGRGVDWRPPLFHEYAQS